MTVSASLWIFQKGGEKITPASDFQYDTTFAFGGMMQFSGIILYSTWIMVLFPWFGLGSFSGWVLMSFVCVSLLPSVSFCFSAWV